ncbi:hypothetical protein AMQ84_12035 [Paenibacillus riograndensis]|uniref:Uncharacterized protein n=1 Tax=Paenibacillus riograndensis TaxID=483937 RepID=A0A132U1P7_9BACL|nr:hypothetical protein AMQ84_12035 [Paenibacillus riograndensis]
MQQISVYLLKMSGFACLHCTKCNRIKNPAPRRLFYCRKCNSIKQGKHATQIRYGKNACGANWCKRTAGCHARLTKRVLLQSKHEEAEFRKTLEDASDASLYEAYAGSKAHKLLDDASEASFAAKQARRSRIPQNF